MKATAIKAVGWLLILLGAFTVAFSGKIVFPGFEFLLGIETIVGKDNVSYQPDGSYLFTNPGAMMRWILPVAAVGILICVSGVLMLFRARSRENSSLDVRTHVG